VEKRKAGVKEGRKDRWRKRKHGRKVSENR
jgi:hypothetical protein